MSKELEKEYLEDLDHYDEGIGIHSTSYKKCKERLIRLAQIENAKPSEALECLETLFDIICEREHTNSEHSFWLKNYNSIKQALLKAEKLEKAWEIVKGKNVTMFELKCCSSAKSYNECISFKIGFVKNYELTQQEFDLLKEVLE